MRMRMEELLATSKEAGKSITAAGVPQLLDVAIALAAAEISDYHNTLLRTLRDLSMPMSSPLQRVAALVEARAAALAPFLVADAKFQRCKLTLIRSCNELLRRLSKSKKRTSEGAFSCSWLIPSHWPSALASI